jgi:hypothetical protein
VVEREAEPALCFGLPQRRLMTAVIDAKRVPHTSPRELAMEANVLRREEVLIADVEREERGTCAKVTAQSRTRECTLAYAFAAGDPTSSA